MGPPLQRRHGTNPQIKYYIVSFVESSMPINIKPVQSIKVRMLDTLQLPCYFMIQTVLPTQDVL